MIDFMQFSSFIPMNTLYRIVQFTIFYMVSRELDGGWDAYEAMEGLKLNTK